MNRRKKKQADLFIPPPRVLTEPERLALLDGPFEDVPPHPEARPDTSVLLPLSHYDHILLMFSGGKDSEAAAIHLMLQMQREGAPLDRLELWHQLVDGGPDEQTFMDWPVTHAYCEAAAKALGLPIRFQWREGGFLREMLRENEITAPVTFETSKGRHTLSSGGEPSTRRMFPQVSGDLRVRYCSAYLKIDVAARAINNDPRFVVGQKLKPGQRPLRMLVVTGERREEGGKNGGRARYATVEQHRCSNQSRRVDHWRPVLGWPEARVWATLREKGIVPHPCYFVGYGRASCARCIFGQEDEWATGRILDPLNFARVAGYEQEFGVTIHKGRSVTQKADRGKPLAPVDVLAAWKTILEARSYGLPIVVPDAMWTLPLGAFRHGAGPT